jgi:hypothetical protein
MSTADSSPDNDEVRIVRTTSTFDCGGRCPLRLHVKGNRIIRVEGDEGPEPDQLRTCLRCRAYRQMVHHPERLMFPQKKVGAKGEGKFKRISWDVPGPLPTGEASQLYRGPPGSRLGCRTAREVGGTIWNQSRGRGIQGFHPHPAGGRLQTQVKDQPEVKDLIGPRPRVGLS